ncbi:hypothetical protein HDV05_005531 [Chytridiales sp. JEL 0842]|nr:hypothetical protein HDV05_005531 [Chytridiales sp. JEL 0842]
MLALLPSTLLILVLMDAMTAAQSPSLLYAQLGCYMSTFLPNTTNISYILREFYTTDPSLTTSKCSQLATERGFKYFGTHNGTDCYAGNEVYLRNEIEQDQYCNTPCVGDTSQICGSNRQVSVYSTSPTDFSAFPGYQPLSSKPSLPAGVPRIMGQRYSYVGCMNNLWWQQLFRGGSLERNITVNVNMTLDICQSAAAQAGARHFGIAYGTRCTYGNDIFWPTERKVEDLQCSTQCAGMPREVATDVCGSEWRMSLYRLNDPPVSESGGLSTASIIGIVVGVLAIVVLAIGGAVMIRRKHLLHASKDRLSDNSSSFGIVTPAPNSQPPSLQPSSTIRSTASSSNASTTPFSGEDNNYIPINNKAMESIFHFWSRSDSSTVSSKPSSSYLKIQTPERAMEVDRLNPVMGGSYPQLSRNAINVGVLAPVYQPYQTPEGGSASRHTASSPSGSRKTLDGMQVFDEKKMVDVEEGIAAAATAEEIDEPPPSYNELM